MSLYSACQLDARTNCHGVTSPGPVLHRTYEPAAMVYSAELTLRHGFEKMARRVAPEIMAIVDTTDHAAGKMPFYEQIA